MSNSTKPESIDILHAEVQQQPVGVADLSPCILSRYTAPAGTVKMAGCSIDCIPIFEISLPASQDSTASSADPAEERSTRYLNLDGSPVSPELVDSLELASAICIDGLPTDVRPSSFEQMFQSAMSAISKVYPSVSVCIDRVIWYREATGKIRIAIGDSSATVAFQGSTRELRSGKKLPPPFQCEQSGFSSYHIVADDLKQLTVEEALAECSISHQSVVKNTLKTSSFSGAMALPTYFSTCPVTGDSVLKQELVSCSCCGQAVSPSTIRGTCCSGCGELPKADSNLLEKYQEALPENCRTGSPSAGEANTITYFRWKQGWTKYLLVLEKASHKQLAYRHKRGWFGKWQPVDSHS